MDKIFFLYHLPHASGSLLKFYDTHLKKCKGLIGDIDLRENSSSIVTCKCVPRPVLVDCWFLTSNRNGYGGSAPTVKEKSMSHHSQEK